MVTELASPGPSTVDRPVVRCGVPVVLLAAAALGWWWSVRMARGMGPTAMGDMGMSEGSAVSTAGFFVAWLAMMAAMMLPAIAPVVRLYARASGLHRVAPLPYFVGGYLVVWMLLGVPAYFAWRALDGPLAQGAPWVGRLAGGAFIAAGVWQLTPLKELCLRHCRAPMSFFLRYGRRLERPLGASRMGASHGLFCVGCCWALFALLVALGTMNIGWMLGLTALIVIEKTFPRGRQAATIAGFAFVLVGLWLVVSPDAITTIA